MTRLSWQGSILDRSRREERGVKEALEEMPGGQGERAEMRVVEPWMIQGYLGGAEA